MKQLLLIAARSLFQHKRRNLLLGAAIAAVTGLLVLLVSLSNGIRTTMLESATTLVSGHLNVGGFYKVSAGQSAPVVTDYQKVAELIRTRMPEVQTLIHRGRGWAKLVSEMGSIQAGISGIDITNEAGFRQTLSIKEGNLDELAKPNTALLFEQQAKKLEVKVGDVLTITAFTLRGATNTVDVRVAAIAKDVGLLSAWNTFVPIQTLRTIYQFNDTSTGALLLYLKKLDDASAVEAKLRTMLTEQGYRLMDKDPRAFWMKFEVVNREDWTGQKLDVTTWEDEISFMSWTLQVLKTLTGVLTFILLVVISVGIMNTLWISIRERTREIGTLRAIGMQRWSVLAMFLFEAMILTVGGALTGALAGALLGVGLNLLQIQVNEGIQLFIMRDTLTLRLNVPLVALCISVIAVCTTLVSLIPSFLAARMKPVTAMHHIG